VTTDLPGWFASYNGRQTIEAGIKEGKNVFQMHHLKVRSPAGLMIWEEFAVFAANASAEPGPSLRPFGCCVAPRDLHRRIATV
jgi:hypothetical protein